MEEGIDLICSYFSSRIHNLIKLLSGLSVVVMVYLVVCVYNIGRWSKLLVNSRSST